MDEFKKKVGKIKQSVRKKSPWFLLDFQGLFPFFRRGNTFIELLIVVAIIGIGASVAIVSLSPAKTQAKLKAAQTELTSSIKQTQSYALQGRMAGGSTPAKYGLEITGVQAYRIFYCSASNCAAKIPVETFSLADLGVNFDSGDVGKQVTFDVPHGNPSLSANLLITLNFSGQTKTVTVVPGGSILEN